MTLITGALFWGCLFAGLLVGTLIGLIMFFFLWQGSLYAAQRVVAFAVGLLIVILIRVLIMCRCRSRFFVSFYRKKPAGANIYFLAMEWANFALAAGFVFVRMIKLIFVAAFSVGRIDSPFLARRVGEIGPIELDPFPTIHQRDIMSHEAHRHPFIEALGTIYLMKLKHGTLFGSNAGSCWRLIFVYALMPWMQKYRIFDAPTKVMLAVKGNHSVVDDPRRKGKEAVLDQDICGSDSRLLRDRSSITLTPAMLKATRAMTPATAGTTNKLNSTASSNALSSTAACLLQKKDSLQCLRDENDALRQRVAELEGLLG